MHIEPNNKNISRKLFTLFFGSGLKDVLILKSSLLIPIISLKEKVFKDVNIKLQIFALTVKTLMIFENLMGSNVIVES